MSKYGNVEFRKEVGKAYEILWKMYKPEGGCEWDSMQESMLLGMLNAMDDIMGWGDERP